MTTELSFNRLFGGAAGGLSSLYWGTDDFFLSANDFSNGKWSSLGYTVAGIQGFWSSGKISLSITQQASSVPEPATLALAGAGLLGMLGFQRRRKIKKQ